MLAFLAVQISLRTIGVAAPPFAFAFVAIAWSTRSTGFVGRVLTASACAVWVYAISPGLGTLELTPARWWLFAGLEALGLLAVARVPRRAQANVPTGEGTQAELATLVDAVPGLVFYIDRDYRYVRNNATFGAWFGVDPQRLRGTAVEDVIGAEAFARVKPEIARALAGEHVHFETHLPYQHGGSRWIEAHLTPHRVESGEVCGCVGLVHDIAERKQREKEHADALAGYRFLADAMPQIVWTTQPDGQIDTINWRWFHLTGQLPGSAVADTWLDAVHPEDRQTTRDAWAHARQHGEPYEVQHRIRRASDGAYLWHLSRAVPRRDASGNVVQWVGSSTDIDLQCRAYAELAEAREQLGRHAADLETRIRERTASLEEAVSELRILTSSVSHDLRTPLHIVQSFIEEIAADRGNHLTPESTELLARVGYSTRRMSTLMQDLLSYTGISHASQHIRELALAEVIQEVLDQHRNAIRDGGGRVTVETPLLSVLADQTSTFQVLSNLISNALKFTTAKRPLELRIRTEAVPPHVRLWVEDNGIGIAPGDHERIFRLFERLDGARSRPGNGVGLALVRKAMLRMGGSAGVESQPGQGSRFWVEFRAPADHAASNPS